MKKKSRRKSPIPRRAWDFLSPALQGTRKRALSVLSRMRQGSPLAAAAREIGIDPRTVTTHLGKALAKRADGKYHAKPTDRISRSLIVYSQGKQIAVTVPDSATASTIGQYFNAVRKYLNTGDNSSLKKFKNVIVVDSTGNKYRLETDGKKIRSIESEKEDSEGFDIYNDGGSS